METIERIKEFIQRFIDETVAWYDELEQLYQYGVLFLIIVLCLLIIAYVMLSRITR